MQIRINDGQYAMNRSNLKSQVFTLDKQRHFSTEMNLFYWSKLQAADVMSSDVVSVRPNQTLHEAALIMEKKRISCVAVCTDNQIVGILSQRDIVASARSHGSSEGVRVCDKMSHSVETISPETPVLYASLIMEEKGFRRLPVVSKQGIVGIVTQTDLVQAFESMSALRNVTEIMTTDIATIAPDQNVAQVVDIMVQKGISSVLVTHNDKAVGIITEKDILHTVIAQRKDPEQIEAVDIMSFPLITISVSHSVLSASRLMYDNHLHRLVVADDQGAKGIITRTDILKAYQSCAQHESQQELYLLTHTDEAIILLDSEGITTFINPAFMRLFEADSPDCFINQLFPPDQLWANSEDKHSFAVNQDLEPGGMQSLFLRKMTGGYLSINLCFSKIKDLSGNVIGQRGMAWDMAKEVV
jgi:predicted transcriptional regulator